MNKLSNRARQLLVASLGFGGFFVSGCEIEVKAIDIKEKVTSRSTSGGGCEKKTYEDGLDPSALLFEADVDGKKFTGSVGSVPGKACIESIGETTVSLGISTLEANPDVCPDSLTGLGTITFKELVLTNDKKMTLRVSCTDAVGKLNDKASVEEAVNNCAKANVATIGEWLRQSFNAEAKSLSFAGTVDCSSDACYVLNGDVKARIANLKVHVMKGCTDKRQ